MAHHLILSCPADSDMNNWSAEKYAKYVETFLQGVEQRFRHDVGTKNTYPQFLGAATGFQEKSIDTADWVGCVKELLDGKWWLLLTFANFLPLDHGDRLRREVEPKHHAEKEKLWNMQFTAGEAIDQAQDLVGRIRARFQERNEENVYDAFLATCNKLAKGEKTRYEVLQEVTDLFLPEHADFLNEFRFFLQI
ncbi:hypothetical protein BDL97_14G021900 [Sphagnum fallax]|jgi:histone deacetylase complex regulatory component SIN3|nr:hypothetical protein BDL97_14G021900 [Sphagnum fallax]